MRTGSLAFKRLRKWLCAKKGIALQHRLAIWNSAVKTTYCYGLPSVGFTQSGLRSLVSKLTLQQRMIVGDHSFLTKTTHNDCFDKYQLEPPLIFLRRSCVLTLTGHRRRCNSLSKDDIVHVLQFKSTANAISVIDRLIQLPVQLFEVR